MHIQFFILLNKQIQTRYSLVFLIFINNSSHFFSFSVRLSTVEKDFLLLSIPIDGCLLFSKISLVFWLQAISTRNVCGRLEEIYFLIISRRFWWTWNLSAICIVSGCSSLITLAYADALSRVTFFTCLFFFIPSFKDEPSLPSSTGIGLCESALQIAVQYVLPFLLKNIDSNIASHRFYLHLSKPFFQYTMVSPVTWIPRYRHMRKAPSQLVSNVNVAIKFSHRSVKCP